MNTATEIYSVPAGNRIGDFVELLKPRMNVLILGTTMVGYYTAATDGIDWRQLPHVLIGTALCAAGAAILNQYVERKYDALMPRTSGRPLPSGRVVPIQALILGLLASIAGGIYLFLLVNHLTAILGITTLASYVLVYTPLKRVTTLNTIVGAIPGAIPPLMGWAAYSGTLSLQALTLFGILFVWQIPHFLAIAVMYREDYRLGGFKMLPVNDPTLSATSRQMVLYALALIPVSLTPSLLGVSGDVYAVAAVILGLAFLGFAARCALRRTRREARQLFFASIIYLPALLTVLMFDKW